MVNLNVALNLHEFDGFDEHMNCFVDLMHIDKKEARKDYGQRH